MISHDHRKRTTKNLTGPFLVMRLALKILSYTVNNPKTYKKGNNYSLKLTFLVVKTFSRIRSRGNHNQGRCGRLSVHFAYHYEGQN